MQKTSLPFILPPNPSVLPYSFYTTEELPTKDFKCEKFNWMFSGLNIVLLLEILVLFYILITGNGIPLYIYIFFFGAVMISQFGQYFKNCGLIMTFTILNFIALSFNFVFLFINYKMTVQYQWIGLLFILTLLNQYFSLKLTVQLIYQKWKRMNEEGILPVHLTEDNLLKIFTQICLHDNKF